MTRRCIGLFLLSIAGAAQAQDGADLLSAYRRAESYLPRNIGELASDLAVHPYWSSDGQFFWYRRERHGGWDYVRVNIADGTRVPLFDHAKLALALGRLTGREVRGPADQSLAYR